MRRADRLFDIIQVLRRASGPITADAIAAELETSKRTIYRDIGTLVARRVPIRGEAGIGYVLAHGYDCPPLMLTVDEAKAAALGCQWVVAQADLGLARAARNMLAKIAAAAPNDLRPLIDSPAVGRPLTKAPRANAGEITKLRAWSRQGRKLLIRYIDESGCVSVRVLWPFEVEDISDVQVLMAWCELSSDFRTFHIDHIASVTYLEQRYPEHSADLRRRWLKTGRPEHAVR